MAGKTQRETLCWAVEMLCWVVIHHAVWRVSRHTLLIWDFLLKPMCLVRARCASSFWMPLLAWCFAWRCFRGVGAVGNDRSWGGARGHRGLLIHHGSRETPCTPSCHGCESVGRQWDAVFFVLSLLSAGVTQANCSPSTQSNDGLSAPAAWSLQIQRYLDAHRSEAQPTGLFQLLPSLHFKSEVE